MQLKEWKELVLDANLELVRRGLVIYTWGNVSAIDRERGLVIIKPRGIEYDELTAEDMSVCDLDGKQVEGKLLPSVDLDYHLALYHSFEELGGIAHTHSTCATAFAQACVSIPVQGTTHADHFFGEIPCLPYLPREQVEENYEYNAGKQIVEYFKSNGIDPLSMGAVLCGGHGPFTWGKDAAAAVEHSVILEELARMALMTMHLNPHARLPQYMLNKHYLRKYGKDAYFYQEKTT